MIIKKILKCWEWLRITLILLGITFIGLIIFTSIWGFPTILKTVDANMMQEQMLDVMQAVSELQDFKQVVTMREEANRAKLAKR